VEEVRDGVPIETHYNTYKSIIDRFKWDSGSLYLYVYGKIIMDSDGTLQKIVAEAKQMLVDYKVDDERKDFVTHKMQALKEKLTAAIKLNDTLKISYLIHNNFKHVVDYVYMQNSLPVPPQGLTYEIYDNLTVKPSDRWVERLLTLKGIELAEYVLRAI
ncbi:MAG: hypothetical protein IJ033_00745, partial [Clostridia bacterium]|nr:hypothetical protein [Clostridia bacterium]